MDENDFHFFSDYSIIPSVQPTHATSDMYWAEKRVGPLRIGNAYAYQRLLKLNAWMPLGTDFPAEDYNRLKAFFAAVVRKDAKGFLRRVWYGQCVEPGAGITWNDHLGGKKQTFEEKEKRKP